MESLSPNIDAVDSASGQFVGLLLNWGLFGLLTAQTSTYFTTFSHDFRINKLIVFSVFTLETLQTALLTYDLYHSFVIHFGDVEILELIGLMWFTVPTLCGIVGWIAELFYAWRIYKISRSRRICFIVVLLAFAQLGAAIAEGIRAHTAANMVDLRVQQDPISVLSGVFWVIAMVACDVIIAVVMTYYLLKLRKEFYCDSSFFIRRLMMLTVETGSVTAFAAIVAGILFVGRPESESFNIPGFIIGKLYSNSLLRVLNNRHRSECPAENLTVPVSLDLSSASSQQETRPRDEPSSIGSARLRKRDDSAV